MDPRVRASARVLIRALGFEPSAAARARRARRRLGDGRGLRLGQVGSSVDVREDRSYPEVLRPSRPPQPAAGDGQQSQPPRDPPQPLLTARERTFLNVGWQVMKHQNVAHLFLWLADEEDAEAWRGGSEVVAWQHTPGQIGVKAVPYETLILPSLTTLN